MSQKIMQYQAALQLAAQAPNLYDLPLLHSQRMELIGIPNADEVVPNEEDVKPRDPVTEKQDILTLSPVKAFESQDHQAHLQVHMVLKNDPEMGQQVQNTQLGGASLAALDAHIREHLGFQFRDQIEEELGIELPPMGDPLPRDIEKRLSVLVAQAAEQMLGKKQQQLQQARIAEQQQDPVIQQRQQELDIRSQEVQRKTQADQQKAMLAEQRLAADIQEDQQKIALEEERLRLDAEKLLADMELERKKLEIDLLKE